MWGIVELRLWVIAWLIENGAVRPNHRRFHNGGERRKWKIWFLCLPGQDLLCQLFGRRDRTLFVLILLPWHFLEAEKVRRMGEHFFDFRHTHLCEQWPTQLIVPNTNQSCRLHEQAGSLLLPSHDRGNRLIDHFAQLFAIDENFREWLRPFRCSYLWRSAGSLASFARGK